MGNYVLNCYKLREAFTILNQLQPKDKEPGGWSLVFKYLETEEFRSAFKLNEFVIIQIDTDRHQDIGFDITHFASTEDLIEKVKAKIITKIGYEFYAQYSQQIIFAISVHSIECWLCPFYAKLASQASKELNCCETVNQILSKEYNFTLDCNKGEGAYNFFFKAAKPLQKHKNVFPDSYKANLSLRYFIENELLKILPPVKPDVI